VIIYIIYVWLFLSFQHNGGPQGLFLFSIFSDFLFIILYFHECLFFNLVFLIHFLFSIFRILYWLFFIFNLFLFTIQYFLIWLIYYFLTKKKSKRLHFRHKFTKQARSMHQSVMATSYSLFCILKEFYSLFFIFKHIDS